MSRSGISSPDELLFRTTCRLDRYRRTELPLILGICDISLRFIGRYGVGSLQIDFIFYGLVGPIEALHQQ